MSVNGFYQPPYLVQRRDDEGFWVNVAEEPSWQWACKVAQIEANETGQTHRAVHGPKREGARLFEKQRKQSA